jgi:hypothetical protein
MHNREIHVNTQGNYRRNIWARAPTFTWDFSSSRWHFCWRVVFAGRKKHTKITPPAHPPLALTLPSAGCPGPRVQETTTSAAAPNCCRPPTLPQGTTVCKHLSLDRISPVASPSPPAASPLPRSPPPPAGSPIRRRPPLHSPAPSATSWLSHLPPAASPNRRRIPPVLAGKTWSAPSSCSQWCRWRPNTVDQEELVTPAVGACCLY